METKCIKNVDEETLKKFRDLNEKNSRNFWNEILFGEKLITDKDIQGFLGAEYAPSFKVIENYALSINPECV